ncbi:terminal EAR1-like 1 [Prunus dulcis]|uniref:Terminal EAR1-like 1 n=1 Tax=Prunus dulcis TaxID=3755 RepID=A0A4Y1RA01_PRUDU|nr:terminal EAR1-like 1 [Prunus dulcis]
MKFARRTESERQKEDTASWSLYAFDDLVMIVGKKEQHLDADQSNPHEHNTDLHFSLSALTKLLLCGNETHKKGDEENSFRKKLLLQKL